MKKILLIIIVFAMILSLIACGPNYKDELDVLIGDLENLTDDWVDYATSFGDDTDDIDTFEELNAFYQGFADDSQKYIDRADDLSDELNKIKDGIKPEEYDAYNAALKALSEGISDIQSDAVNAIVPQ
jgi:hypothetical protein